ncbi:MAG TPA: hypothetical protein VNV60_08055 [Holophagaceae bacterium]|jgi:hypothetical protein|nr:hypothetical protein [Holophagaceae bacterium]
MKRTLLAASALAALLGCNHEAAAPKTDVSAVLANVNGIRITQAQLEATVRAGLQDAAKAEAFLKDPALQAQRAQLVHQLATQAAIEQLAAKAGIENDPSVVMNLAQARANIYASVLASRAAGNATPTEEQMKAFYEEQVAARKATGQGQDLPDYAHIDPRVKAMLPRLVQQAQFQKAQEAFQKDLKTQVPVTYADGLQSPEAEY